jgi:hypothetical protein
MKWRSLEESAPGTDTRPLREIFAERKELIAQYVPAATQAVHARVIADLKAKGLAERSIGVGRKRPLSRSQIIRDDVYRLQSCWLAGS